MLVGTSAICCTYEQSVFMIRMKLCSYVGDLSYKWGMGRYEKWSLWHSQWCINFLACVTICRLFSTKNLSPSLCPEIVLKLQYVSTIDGNICVCVCILPCAFYITLLKNGRFLMLYYFQVHSDLAIYIYSIYFRVYYKTIVIKTVW